MFDFFQTRQVAQAVLIAVLGHAALVSLVSFGLV